MDNILAIKLGLIERIKSRRKEARLSQSVLANRTGVSLGSIKRLENKGEISLSALFKIAVVLGYEDDFNQLFARKNFQSLDEIIDAK
ncbi:helix-turn-helix transcriptional regulator [Deferribacterales bacterium RsTz2092]|nr:transcriptional regulator [Deferribacterales bacterium]